jgi:uncharacterized protein YndB with AHSA1/START domain
MQATTQETSLTTPSEREAVLVRVFAAPREVVFKTVLDPDLIPDWWGPKRLSVRVDQMEVKPGGAWRFVLRDSASRVFSFHGAFREIRPPERVTYTFECEGLPGHEVLETIEFEDLGGERTRVAFTSLFDSQVDRDQAMRWGIRDGGLETAARLARLLTRCAARPSRKRPAAAAPGTDGDSRPS